MTNTNRIPFEKLDKEEGQEMSKRSRKDSNRQLDLNYEHGATSPTALSIRSNDSASKSSRRSGTNSHRSSEAEISEEKREGRSSLKKRTPLKKSFEFSVDSKSPSIERHLGKTVTKT